MDIARAGEEPDLTGVSEVKSKDINSPAKSEKKEENEKKSGRPKKNND